MFMEKLPRNNVVFAVWLILNSAMLILKVSIRYINLQEMQVLPYTDRSFLINVLNTTSTIPVIIQKEPNHWVVGTNIDKQAQTVNFVDPKYTNINGTFVSGSVPFSQINCLIY